ncbi:serine/threonine-protein kinase TAO3-like protein [Lates japonicus]|uniref:Serine/threonine-protein kinase TAO3-like protein n=1 Tax=Lates japonicus TaxID=270547 RepID=A0AAD3MK77_LATJO|nr:serine/threonine-protein kinase TAO3-like protein [Lates japonicus]
MEGLADSSGGTSRGRMHLTLDVCCIQGDSADHACVRDEAVHRDTRPELRPTSHKSRSLDCKICEHIATIKSASLVIR